MRLRETVKFNLFNHRKWLCGLFKLKLYVGNVSYVLMIAGNRPEILEV